MHNRGPLDRSEVLIELLPSRHRPLVGLRKLYANPKHRTLLVDRTPTSPNRHRLQGQLAHPHRFEVKLKAHGQAGFHGSLTKDLGTGQIDVGRHSPKIGELPRENPSTKIEALAASAVRPFDPRARHGERQGRHSLRLFPKEPQALVPAFSLSIHFADGDAHGRGLHFP